LVFSGEITYCFYKYFDFSNIAESYQKEQQKACEIQAGVKAPILCPSIRFYCDLNFFRPYQQECRDRF